MISNLLATTTVNNVESTQIFFTSNYSYIIIGILTIYSIIATFVYKMDNVRKVKRIFYTSCMWIYVFTLHSYDLSWISKDGLFGITGQAWSLIIFSVAYFLLLIILDIYIISGYVFKEVGIFSARFIKEETKDAVVNQYTYSQLLERNIVASFRVIEEMRELFDSRNIRQEILQTQFDFFYHFKNFIRSYYTISQIDATVDIEIYSNVDVECLINSFRGIYNLNSSNRRDLRNCLNNIGSYSFKKDEYNLFFLTCTTGVFPGEKVLIAIKSIGPVSPYDEYNLTNLLYHFELEYNSTGYILRLGQIP